MVVSAAIASADLVVPALFLGIPALLTDILVSVFAFVVAALGCLHNNSEDP